MTWEAFEEFLESIQDASPDKEVKRIRIIGNPSSFSIKLTWRMLSTPGEEIHANVVTQLQNDKTIVHIEYVLSGIAIFGYITTYVLLMAFDVLWILMFSSIFLSNSGANHGRITFVILAGLVLALMNIRRLTASTMDPGESDHSRKIESLFCLSPFPEAPPDRAVRV